MRIRHLSAGIILVLIFILSGNASSLLAQGALSNITTTISDNIVGATAIYTFTFTTSDTGNGDDLGNDEGIPSDGKIRLTFDSGFDFSDLIVVNSQNSNMTGGLSISSIIGNVVTISRDGTGNNVPVSTPVSLSLGTIGNSSTAGNYNVDIITMTSGGTYIDAGPTPNFSIVAGTIDHFIVSTSGNATAGSSFAVIITAKDANNNTVTSHSAAVALTDLTDTITPITSGNFSGGVWNGNVMFTKSRTDNKITATWSGITGMSSEFDVLPAALHHFTFTTITSPKTANAPFSITVTARDVYENLVTSYVSTVTLTDLSGSLNMTSNSFSAGSLTQNVTITKSQTDDYITATGSTKTGTSNLFNVNPGSLSKFSIGTISSPQTAEEYFSIALTAQDASNNTVTSFSGTVNITDKSGTITPGVSPGFSGGKWNGQVKISDDYTNDQITVTRSGGSETGTSNSFNVLVGSLDHFTISTIATPQMAGDDFTITVTAKDKSENTVTSYAGTATLIDITGTISPQVSGNFGSGVWTGAVTIYASGSGNKIIVTGSDKTGTSNSFNVSPAGLDHFSFSEIASPQIAGAPISMTIEANDAYENIITGFSSTVTLSDESGTLTPTTSGNFSSGVWTGSVTITKAYVDNKITAISTGKNGVSNNFNVNADGLDYILIRDNPGGLGAEVGDLTLNFNDQVVLYAAGYDQYDNYINDVTANWDTAGTLLDMPSPLVGTSTTYRVETVNTSSQVGKIWAVSGGEVDSTGTITVAEIDHVLIRDADNGEGNVVASRTISADETLTLYAAAYDAGNNYLGPAVVNWTNDGTLTPAISSTNATLVFQPTSAPASGKIIATHATANDDTTGMVTVVPGVPVGEIVLHPNPKVVPADPDTVTTVSSDPISDSDGNAISSGEYFTVSTTLGTITSADANPGIGGTQVVSNASGQIAFTVKTGVTGGTALIQANSVVRGTAAGDTSVVITGIEILSLSVDFTKVSRSQQDIPVDMTVQNWGATGATIMTGGAGLKFTGPAPGYSNRSGDYVVVRTDTFSVIPGNGIKTLSFLVDVNANALTDSIEIDGFINCNVNGFTVGDEFANETDKWLVQTPPAFRFLRVTAGEDTVIQGTNTIVKATIKNDGDATALIDSVRFMYSNLTPPILDVTDDYALAPYPTNPASIEGHSLDSLFFTVTVGSNAAVDDIGIDGKIFGRDQNSGLAYSDINADTTDSWHVKQASDLEIVAFNPSQRTVTSGQVENWFLDMVIDNNGGANLRLDSVRVDFTYGGADISSEYATVYPDIFQTSGDNLLRAGAIDTLRITIDKTGTTIGAVTVGGTVYLNDMISGQLIKSKLTGVTVQAPGALTIKYIRSSQPEVTTGQTQDWSVSLALTNNGGGDIAIDTTRLADFFNFGADPNYTVQPPASFAHSGNFVLVAGATDSLIFTIDSTGTIAGMRSVNVSVFAEEINSHDPISIAGVMTIEVEIPANIRILKTVSLAPNAPYVDNNQLFQIAVLVQNQGGDAAKNIEMSLVRDSTSTILNPQDTLPIVQGMSIDTLKFNVQASSNWIWDEIFTATIDTATAENTLESDKIIFSSPVDSVDTTVVQRPAKFKIVTISPSQDTVRALSPYEWQITVAVEDSGAGYLRLNPPDEEDVTISINGQAQDDYTIVPPNAFEVHPDLMLSWHETDALVYRVTSTGVLGGSARIKINLSGRYLNSDTPFQVMDSTWIYIRPSADVFIDKTEPVCRNINQYGIGQVNTSQSFSVKSKIRNTGGEQVDDVVVSLTAPGYSIPPATIDYILPSGEALATFTFNAQAVASEQVKFTATILSAVSHGSGLSAIIGAASDSTALVRVHTPALMRLSILTENTIFSVGQSAPFQVEVENLGTAEADASGELAVFMPQDYFVLANEVQKVSDTTSFEINETITWEVLPPSTESIGDTIIVKITKPPVDKNTGLFALIENTDPFDSLVVRTVPLELSLNSFEITSPAGATDDTLSTLQNFYAQVNFTKSENISSVTARLKVPNGYTFATGTDSVKANITDYATWRLIAPEDARSNEELIRVEVSGYVGADYVTAKDSISVVVENRATLLIDRLWISWPSTDSTLSMSQEFDLSAIVINSGDAKIDGQTNLKIDFGATGVTTSDDAIKAATPDMPVTWRLRAPAEEKLKAPIVVSIETIPRDVNTNEKAVVTTRSKYFYVQTQQSATASIENLRIISPSGAIDKVFSTYQTFQIEADVNWYNCTTAPSVQLQLEGGFTTPESYPKVPNGVDGQGTVNWTITAPGNSITDQNIWLKLTAQDANSRITFTRTSDSLEVDVLRRATIQLNGKINSPKSALDGIVSTNQNFVVCANLSRFGDANILGNFSATLKLPSGLGYSTAQNLTLSTTHSDSLFWTITAPASERVPDNITVTLISWPEDENTNLSIAAEAVLLKNVYIPVSTEEKSVTVEMLPPPLKNTIARGDTMVSMLGLELLASGDSFSNNILFTGVKIRLKDRTGALISNPAKVISRIRVVNNQQNSQIYGQVTSIPTSNPVEILFTQVDTLKPEIENQVQFKVDIAANSEISDFRMAIDSVTSLYLFDEESGQTPKLKNASGQSLELLNFESEPSVIIESNFDKAFSNYPNPFGEINRPVTNFVYYLDEDTDVKIQIYTLIGELVWERTYTEAESQGREGLHDSDIIWDGRNGQGHKVLNGVYVARISTGYGKAALRKIAVIK
ncbi:MAG: hypothetical protein ACOY90_15885 [Candidatus Zhuqueibacterota bacterium]